MEGPARVAGSRTRCCFQNIWQASGLQLLSSGKAELACCHMRRLQGLPSRAQRMEKERPGLVDPLQQHPSRAAIPDLGLGTSQSTWLNLYWQPTSRQIRLEHKLPFPGQTIHSTMQPHLSIRHSSCARWPWCPVFSTIFSLVRLAQRSVDYFVGSPDDSRRAVLEPGQFCPFNRLGDHGAVCTGPHRGAKKPRTVTSRP